MDTSLFAASCRCGSNSFSFEVLSTLLPLKVLVDHSLEARKISGEFFASWVEVPNSVLSGFSRRHLTEYKGYSFCDTCGCSVLREGAEVGSVRIASGLLKLHGGERDGVIIHEHLDVPSTIDGGAAPWFSFSSPSSPQYHYSLPVEPLTTSDTLQASCDCGRISFRIALNPNPDPNARAVNDFRYGAGFCFCDMCVTTSGFEISSWTWIYKASFVFSDGSNLSSTTTPSTITIKSEDIESIFHTQSYESSKGYYRHFCPTCGAKVFWDNAVNSPARIETSVGLFHPLETVYKSHKSSDPSKVAGAGSRRDRWFNWLIEGNIDSVSDAKHLEIAAQVHKMFEEWKKESGQRMEEC